MLEGVQKILMKGFWSTLILKWEPWERECMQDSKISAEIAEIQMQIASERSDGSVI